MVIDDFPDLAHARERLVVVRRWLLILLAVASSSFMFVDPSPGLAVVAGALWVGAALGWLMSSSEGAHEAVFIYDLLVALIVWFLMSPTAGVAFLVMAVGILGGIVLPGRAGERAAWWALAVELGRIPLQLTDGFGLELFQGGRVAVSDFLVGVGVRSLVLVWGAWAARKGVLALSRAARASEGSETCRRRQFQAKVGERLDVGISTKLAGLVLIPLAAAMLMGGLRTMDHIEVQREMEQLIPLTELVVLAEGLVNELQVERGRAAVHLGSEGPEDRVAIFEQFDRTDAAIAGFREEFDSFEAGGMDHSLVIDAKDIDDAVDRLPGVRRATMAETEEWQSIVDFYTTLIENLHGLSHSVLPYASHDEDLADLYELFDFMSEVGEAAGQERALVSTMLAQPQLAGSDRYLVAHLQGRQDALLTLYAENVPAETRARHADHLDEITAGPVLELRRQVVGGSDPVEPDVWFRHATERIEVINDVERALLADVVARSTELVDEARLAALRLIGLGILVLAVSGAGSWWIKQRLVGRIDSLTEAVTALHLGAPERRAEETGNDELAVLASTFNHMADEMTAMIAAKDDLIASVAHELRTPLTSVIGFAEILQEGTAHLAAEDQAAMIRAIADQGTDLSNIVDDLLTSAKIRADTLATAREPVNLTKECASTLAILGHKSEGKWISLEGADVTALGDAGRVRQVLRNLVANAIHYGGSHIKVEVDRAGPTARVVVADDGDGIPDEQREMIFAPYQRIHQTTGLTLSMGLGLAISRELARRMEGDLTYRHDGGWSFFELTLPAYDPLAANRPQDRARD